MGSINLKLGTILSKVASLLSLGKVVYRSVNGLDNQVSIAASARLRNCKIIIMGHNNKVEIAPSVLLNKTLILIRGNKNLIKISEGVIVAREGEFWVEDDECKITVGKSSTFEQIHLAATESGSVIEIGDDCMFAYDIDVRTGDSHSIINSQSGQRINYAQNIEIGNHVWIASHVSILKGVKICDNSVVATRSVLTRPFNKKGILIGGIPARELKEDITWDRKRI